MAPFGGDSYLYVSVCVPGPESNQQQESCWSFCIFLQGSQGRGFYFSAPAWPLANLSRGGEGGGGNETFENQKRFLAVHSLKAGSFEVNLTLNKNRTLSHFASYLNFGSGKKHIYMIEAYLKQAFLINNQVR